MRPRNVTCYAFISLNESFLGPLNPYGICQEHHPSTLPKFRRPIILRLLVVFLRNPTQDSSNSFCGAQNPAEKFSVRLSGGNERGWDRRCAVSFVQARVCRHYRLSYKKMPQERRHLVRCKPGRDEGVSMKSHSISATVMSKGGAPRGVHDDVVTSICQ